jgi:hypothetical protein
MAKKQAQSDTDARNRGVQKEADEQREPAGHPPRERVRGKGAAEDNAAAEDPAAIEHLENPPQVEGPRERLNDASGAKGVE